MGVAYGFSANNRNCATVQRTDDLLAELTQRVVFQMYGPRAIVGDFNSHHQLDQYDIWKANGFIEIQALAEARWGQSIRPTCRQKSVLDQVWVSSELAAWITEVCVDDSFFPDHACLFARLQLPKQKFDFQVWRQPMAIPWDDVPTTIHSATFHDSLPSPSDLDLLPQLFRSLEDRVDLVCQRAGMNGLLPQQRGRCQTTCAKTKRHMVTPLKRSRAFEVQVTFMGEHFDHVMWCRQLRRLQSFANTQSDALIAPHKATHRTQVWQAIRAAPGFPRGFPKFWSERPVLVPDAPLHLPRQAPTQAVARLIFLNFRKMFEGLEKALIRQRGQQARQLRAVNPNRAFQDVAKPRALPVQTLAWSQVATVTEVDGNTGQIQYEPHHFRCDEIVRGPLGHLCTTEHTPGCLTVADTSSVTPGDTLTQTQLQGNPSEVVAAFVNLWRPMWNKHAEVPDSRWDELHSRILDVIPSPKQELVLPPITLEEWKKCVRGKKARTAAGPDGISRADLLNMPNDLAAQLVAHVNLIEQGQLNWHPASMTGLIALVEKHAAAQRPQDYRPICVLSLIYRCWGSLRAKQCLKWIDQFVSANHLGNRPGVSTRSLWWKLAQELELHVQEGTCAAGIITDVVKCFNTLPRQAVALCARRVGLPKAFVHCWLHSISMIERRFVVGGYASNAVPSCTGFPEGDSLSVLAMALMNIIMHRTMETQVPRAKIVSYVDNWEGLADTAEEVPQIMQCFHDFAALTDIALDVAKTTTWCLQPDGRKHLRQSDHAVILSCRDLGGQMVYCRKPSIQTIKTRLQQQADVWSLLARSQATAGFKMRLLHTVVWPRCLHGISNLSLGPAHFDKMRSLAMQALRWNTKGANSALQFGLNRDLRSDPGFYSLLASARDFRELHDPQIAFPLLDALAHRTDNQKMQGPCAALLARLHDVGWRWEGQGYVMDHDHLRWSLVDSPIQWMQLRLQQAWTRKVGHQIASRPTFKGLQAVDTFATHQGIEKLCPAAQGFMRTAQNGTFFTRDQLVRTGKVAESKCPWCPAEDSIGHRQWFCPAFANVRYATCPDARAMLLQEPSCFKYRGWVVESEVHTAFRAQILAVPDTTGVITWPQHGPRGHLHLFTDGSCTTPGDPATRLASWGVVLADLSNHTFAPIASGGVHGGTQTTVRAELCAAIAACQAAIQARMDFTIWTDNAFVHKKLCQFLTGGFQPARAKQPNHDLVNALMACCRKAHALGLAGLAVKVRSHEDEQCYPEVVEAWAIEGNAQADALADQAQQHLPPALRAVWSALCDRVQRQTAMRECIRAIILGVAFQGLSDKTHTDAVTESQWEQRLQQSRVYDLADISLAPLPATMSLPPRHTLGVHAEPLFNWLQQLTSGAGLQPMWVCSHQLLVHFQGTTGKKGFQFNQKTNRWDATDSADPTVWNFHKSASSFQAALKCLAVALAIPYKPIKRLPDGPIFRCWVNCLLIRTDPAIFDKVHSLMQQRGAIAVQSVRVVTKNWGDFCGALA